MHHSLFWWTTLITENSLMILQSILLVTYVSQSQSAFDFQLNLSKYLLSSQFYVAECPTDCSRMALLDPQLWVDDSTSVALLFPPGHALWMTKYSYSKTRSCTTAHCFCWLSSSSSANWCICQRCHRSSWWRGSPISNPIGSQKASRRWHAWPSTAKKWHDT